MKQHLSILISLLFLAHCATNSLQTGKNLEGEKISFAQYSIPQIKYTYSLQNTQSVKSINEEGEETIDIIEDLKLNGVIERTHNLEMFKEVSHITECVDDSPACKMMLQSGITPFTTTQKQDIVELHTPISDSAKIPMAFFEKLSKKSRDQSDDKVMETSMKIGMLMAIPVAHNEAIAMIHYQKELLANKQLTLLKSVSVPSKLFTKPVIQKETHAQVSVHEKLPCPIKTEETCVRLTIKLENTIVYEEMVENTHKLLDGFFQFIEFNQETMEQDKQKLRTEFTEKMNAKLPKDYKVYIKRNLEMVMNPQTMFVYSLIDTREIKPLFGEEQNTVHLEEDTLTVTGIL